MARSHHRITTWPTLFTYLSPIPPFADRPAVRRGPKCCWPYGQAKCNGWTKRLAANRQGLLTNPPTTLHDDIQDP